MILAVALAITPIALLIALGYGMRRWEFLADGFWSQAEKLSYFILLPSLFLHSLATSNLAGVEVSKIIIALIVSTLAVAIIMVLLHGANTKNGAAFTSVFQGGVRFNNYVGVTAAVGLFGISALPVAAVANLAVVPTVNILSVLVFARYGTARPTFVTVIRGITFNPLVIACFLGIGFQSTGLGLPAGVEGMFRALGQASLPVGLLCVGAALDLRISVRELTPALHASTAKFVLMPCFTALTCAWLHIDPMTTTILVLFQSLPTASSSLMMARQFGGDAILMARIIAIQTILALGTVPAAIVVSQMTRQ